MAIKNCVTILLLAAIVVGGCNCDHTNQHQNDGATGGRISGEILSEMTIGGKRKVIIKVQKCSEGLEYMLGRQQALDVPEDFEAEPGRTLGAEIEIDGDKVVAKSVEIEPYKFEPREIEIKRRIAEPFSGVKEPGTLVVDSQKNLEVMWERITVLVVPRPDTPKIDFDTEIALAVFMGERQTGGYEIAIDKVVEHENEVIVTYSETSPRPGMTAPQVITRPFQIAVIPKTDKEIKFVRR